MAKEESLYKKRKNQTWIYAAIIAAFACSIIAFSLSKSKFPTPPQSAISKAQQVDTTCTSTVHLEISCVGDVMVHSTQLACQYVDSLGRYDYNNNFQYIKTYIESSDLALCNIETVFAGKPYTGYPYFSAPDELAEALKSTGFDIAITANNHMADKGLKGIERNIETLENNGFIIAGSRTDTTNVRYAMTNVNGVNIAVVAYTYETPENKGRTTINSNIISDETAAHINSFNYNKIDNDLQEIKSVVDAARNAGAQIVIAYYHWGEEYKTSANKAQRNIAQKTVDSMDVDIIFASHPHVLQEAVMLTKANSDKQIPVFFSMGNCISNQRLETLNNRYTETGIIAQVDIDFSINQNKIEAIKMNAIPTWVEKFKKNGKNYYTIIPTDSILSLNAILMESGHLARAQQAQTDAKKILKINNN